MPHERVVTIHLYFVPSHDGQKGIQHTVAAVAHRQYARFVTLGAPALRKSLAGLTTCNAPFERVECYDFHRLVVLFSWLQTAFFSSVRPVFVNAKLRIFLLFSSLGLPH